MGRERKNRGGGPGRARIDEVRGLINWAGLGRGLCGVSGWLMAAALILNAHHHPLWGWIANDSLTLAIYFCYIVPALNCTT